LCRVQKILYISPGMSCDLYIIRTSAITSPTTAMQSVFIITFDAESHTRKLVQIYRDDLNFRTVV
jgi:hypothetical protein